MIKSKFTSINLDNYYEKNKEKYEKKTYLWQKDTEFRELNDAEVSCTLKHIEAIKLASLQDENISLIVEDDVLNNFRYKRNIKKY